MLRVPISRAIRSARRAGALSENASLYDGRAMLASSWILNKNANKYGDSASSGASSAMMLLTALAAAGIGTGKRSQYVFVFGSFSCPWSSVSLCGSLFFALVYVDVFEVDVCVVEYY